MNMPPPPFLARIPGISASNLQECYIDYSVWHSCEPRLMLLANPDPQAYRPPNEMLNVLQVGLPSNFKVSRFESRENTRILERIADDIAAARYDHGGDRVALTVKLRAHDSNFVPIAKRPMLIAGNYRCIGDMEVRSIDATVNGDIQLSREVNDWVCEVCIKLGTRDIDLVPFEKHANAARGLQPSSSARVLSVGAHQIERIDMLVKLLAAKHDMHSEVTESIVSRVDVWLTSNRKTAR